MPIIHKYFTLALFFATSVVFTVNTYGQSVDESAVDNLPLPSALFAKHIEAIGGEESLRTHATQIVDGKLRIKTMGIAGELHVISAAPDKIKSVIKLGQYGTGRSGYNGTVGWIMDPMSGYKVLEGEALRGMIEDADFYSDNLHLGKGAVKQETVETVTFDDGEHFRILLINEDGEESYLYFSRETGLLSGMDKMSLGGGGSMVPTQIRLDNYVEFEGLKTARRITRSQGGIETIIEIDSVSYDTLAENAFELPAEIQAMVSE